TADGLVKKTSLGEYDTNRSGGIIAINLREGDELVSAMLAGAADDVLLVSRTGMSLRLTAHDSALLPLGRATSGVKGRSVRAGGRLRSADVPKAADPRGSLSDPSAGGPLSDPSTGGSLGERSESKGAAPQEEFVFTVTDGGFAK